MDTSRILTKELLTKIKLGLENWLNQIKLVLTDIETSATIQDDSSVAFSLSLNYSGFRKASLLDIMRHISFLRSKECGHSRDVIQLSGEALEWDVDCKQASSA